MRTALLCCVVVLGSCHAIAAGAAPVLLISIDGLHPDYVIDAEKHGLRIPHLRSFLAEGAYAAGVVGVVPTVTYPSHTTILTGVAPAVHGIVANTPFDPLAANADGWYWYAEDVRVPTLFDALAGTEQTSAAINWPVTVGAYAIDFLLPEFWRARTPDDLKLIRALARPEGSLQRLEARLGPFVDGYVDTIESDRVRTDFALAILREHEPRFTAVHLIALDGTEHRDGPYVASVYSTLEVLDGMIGELVAAALANDPATVVAVVSDHGFIATHTSVNLGARFVTADLIRLAPPSDARPGPTIVSWDAQLWPGGGAAAIVLRDREDERLRTRVARLLDEIAFDPHNGIAEVLEGAELLATLGFPEADFLIEFAPGHYFGGALRGELLTPATSRGTHGYLPSRPEMHAAFFIKGDGIPAGRTLGVLDMRSIAPTLARILEVPLPTAERPPVDLH